MCGISGYIGVNNDALKRVVHGLSRLEYRGYDSAGVCCYTPEEFHIFKTTGEVKGLSELINKDAPTLTSNMAIGHTRWATHGEPSVVNAHPHVVGDFAIVHNGIIENYLTLKRDLEQQGYTFKSTTDSEVAAACIDLYYKQLGDVYQAVAKAIDTFEGNYAIVMMTQFIPNQLIAFCNNAPIVVGVGPNQLYVASDEAAFLDYTNQYFRLDSHEMALLNLEQTPTGVMTSYQVFSKPLNQPNFYAVNKQLSTSQKDPSSYDKGNFEHFMLKEICEQPQVIRNTINQYNASFNGTNPIFDLSYYKDITIIGCGSAMYVGEVAKTYLAKLGKKVNVVCASEFRYSETVLDRDDLCIFISQSGETADTLAALELVNSLGIDTLAIVNVPGSSIMVNAKYSIQTLAGSEISVATTKAFSAQLAIFILIYLQNAIKIKQIDANTYNMLIDNLRNLDQNVNSIVNNNEIQVIAQQFVDSKDAFFLGRGVDYALAQEGSLKLKEISYIHAEAYPAGELKHGPIALIDDQTPVICIMCDQTLVGKMVSNIEEVRARGGQIYLISPNTLVPMNFNAKGILSFNNVDAISNLFICLATLQVLSYYIAKFRGCEIDRPKNLAKSVTVE